VGPVTVSERKSWEVAAMALARLDSIVSTASWIEGDASDKEGAIDGGGMTL
jgi:hypothetical protein